MISEQVVNEQRGEQTKNEAVSRQDFNAADAFRIFDSYNMGTISPMDV